jgi:DNA-binding beta-propeller fold protein YncE
VVTSFGFGKDGAVLVIAPGHVAVAVPALDPARRRIGLAAAPDGTLYDTYFVVGEGKHRGGLARLDLATGETDVPAGTLAKPVGVAIRDGVIYVSDQEQGAVYAIRGDEAKPVATGLPSADLLTVLPDGALVTGGKTGVVSRIGLDGEITTLASGFEQVRGTAYDPVGKRLFVVEHSKATSKHKLHIVQL